MSAPILVLAVAIMLASWGEGSHQTDTHHFMTVVQQDRFAGPFARPSARISARGRHVAFSSYAPLVVTDANQRRDVYVLDLSTRQLTLESAGRDGSAANGDSGSPDISGDGRYVVFVSAAGNLADTPIVAGVPRVFLRDRESATTRLLSTSATGGPANGYSNSPAISADGTTVVFESAATDLLRSDVPRGVGVYLMRPSSTERHSPGRVWRRRAARRSERLSERQRQWPIHCLHVKGRPDMSRRAGVSARTAGRESRR